MCLENILKFRNFCDANYTGKFVNDFIEVDNTILANLANENELTGKQYGENLINSAIESVISDLFTSTGDLVFSGSVEKLNYDGRFVGNTPLVNSGVVIRNVAQSELAVINIESVRLKPLFDGAFTVVIDDGIESKEFAFIAQNGIESLFQVDYKTKAKVVKVLIKETDKAFAQSTLSKTTCSSCSGKKFNLVAQSLFNLTPKSDAPAILPIAYMSCDSSDIICTILQNPMMKQVFLKAVSLQVGVMVYDRLSLSNRLNDTTLNINSEAVAIYHNTLVGKYRELMFGEKSTSVRPFVEMVKSSLKLSKDFCVNCNSIISSATAIF
jgi:hypothetical protein